MANKMLEEVTKLPLVAKIIIYPVAAVAVGGAGYLTSEAKIKLVKWLNKGYAAQVETQQAPIDQMQVRQRSTAAYKSTGTNELDSDVVVGYMRHMKADILEHLNRRMDKLEARLDRIEKKS